MSGKEHGFLPAPSVSFNTCLVCVLGGGGWGLLLLPCQEEDTSKYAQILRKTWGFTPYILNVERAFCLHEKDLLPRKSLQKSTLLVLKPFRADHFKTEKKINFNTTFILKSKHQAKHAVVLVWIFLSLNRCDHTYQTGYLGLSHVSFKKNSLPG